MNENILHRNSCKEKTLIYVILKLLTTLNVNINTNRKKLSVFLRIKRQETYLPSLHKKKPSLLYTETETTCKTSETKSFPGMYFKNKNMHNWCVDKF